MTGDPFRIVAREQSGLGSVVSNISGTRRPRLAGVDFYTIHYTGVSRSYRGADVSAHLRHLQRIWAKTKPWEYNYAIGQRGDDMIHEFAGKFQAAHARGSNHNAVGVYLLNGINEPPTETQIRKIQWLRDVLIADGVLRSQPDMRPHRLMPRAATACPGDLVMARWSDIVKPYVGDDAALPYDPTNGKWSLYPHAKKRTVRSGDEGGEVLYLNDVLRIKAGQNVCGDKFNPATTRAVRNLQTFFRLTVDGWVGPQTWRTVDMLATIQ